MYIDIDVYIYIYIHTHTICMRNVCFTDAIIIQTAFKSNSILFGLRLNN